MKDSKFYDDWFDSLPWKTQKEIINGELAEIFRDEGGFIDNAGEWWEEAYEVAIEPEEYWYEMDPEWKDSIYRQYSGQSDSPLKEVFNVKENKMKEFDYKAYVTDNWLLKEAIDRNNQELQVGDSVMVKGRKGTYGPTEVTGFAQGGDEQYVKISGIEIDGKFTTMVGEWQVEKVDSINEAGAKKEAMEHKPSTRVKRLISILTREVQNSQSEDGILDLRPAGMDLTYTSEDGFEIGAYILSRGEDGEIYVSTGPEDDPMSEDDIALTELPNFLQESGASLHEVESLLDAMVEAVKSLP